MTLTARPFGPRGESVIEPYLSNAPRPLQGATYARSALVGLLVLALLYVALSELPRISQQALAASSNASVPSSQTPALKAATHIDPNPGKGGGDITIVEGMALLPESGPAGTIADIQTQKPSADQISIYVVRPGDTLSEIADMYDVSTNTILWSNDLKSSKDIHPGDTLVILPITGVEHVVKKGETLAGIVKKYQGDLEEVKAFNHIAGPVAVGDTIIIPDGIEAPTRTVTTPSRTTHPTANVSGPELVGYFLRPLLGGIKTQGIHGYNGIDIGTPVGSKVFASAGGRVIIARGSGYNGGYGQYITIQHPNGTQTVYGHLSKVYVSPGESVSQGEVIGLSGNTGKSTGAHLHFEIRGAANPF